MNYSCPFQIHLPICSLVSISEMIPGLSHEAYMLAQLMRSNI